MALAALSPILALEIVALAIVGYASVSFLATGNTTLQLESDPSMRGRVMSLWAIAFLGTTPIGGPLLGCIVAAGIGGTYAWRGAAMRRQRTRKATSPMGVSAVLSTDVTEA